MRELDFDELDRAVNTLMGGVAPSAPAPSTDDDTKVITIPSTISDAPSPTMPRFTSPNRSVTNDTTTASVVPSDEPAPEDASPVAERPDATDVSVSRLTIPSRRAGRFMDVVHPSSDMKNPSNAPSERPSRTAVSIAPLTVAEATTHEVPTSATVEDEVVDVPYPAIAEPDTVAEPAPDATMTDPTAATSTASDATLASAESTDDWLDPLAGFDVEPAAESTALDDVAVVAAEPATAVDEDEDEAGDEDLFTIDTTEPDDEPEPLVSPFLTDAKVNKRPLGTASDLSDGEPGRAPALGVLVDETLTNSNPDDQLPPEPIAVEQPLPAELQDDLIAVESDNTSFATPEEPVAESVAAESEAVQPSPAGTDPQPVVATGPTSIQQQYKESAATGDQTNGAIYDTQAYHQPLAHPVKKKSGWMWVVWVLLLLIVGAGGAVALYYFGVI